MKNKEGKKKILWVSNYNLEIGRGPMFRIMNMMESMNKLCELVLFSFGSIDEEICSHAKKLGIRYYDVEYKSTGWFVDNAGEIAQQISICSQKENIDLVVMTWEIWDLIVATHKLLEKEKIPMISIMHSVPFAGMPEKNSLYFVDIIRRMFYERNFTVTKYLYKRWYQAYIFMPKLNILTMTPTVEMRLKTYFKNIKLLTSYPGYAINVLNSGQQKIKYDMAFMARLEQGKGIYDLIDIMQNIKKIKNDATLVMIGSFTFKSDEKRFMKKVKQSNLEKNIIFSGWLNGQEKYDTLKSANIFIYPSYTGDTFSISVLEALALGKKVVCYDVPFSNMNYNETPDLYKEKPHDKKCFAARCIELLDNQETSLGNMKFVEDRFSSWEAVSQSEYNCYEKVIQEYCLRLLNE